MAFDCKGVYSSSTHSHQIDGHDPEKGISGQVEEQEEKEPEELGCMDESGRDDSQGITN